MLPVFLDCPSFIASSIFLTFTCRVSWVLYVVSISRLSILDCPFSIVHPLLLLLFFSTVYYIVLFGADDLYMYTIQ
jgi:hypothetical protein